MNKKNRFSRFVSVLQKEDKHYLFNSITGGLVCIDADITNQIKADKSLFFENKENREFVSYLEENNYLKSEQEDNELVTQLKYKRLKRTFQSSKLSLVIAPTLFCNFKCPYCYEKDLPNEKMPIDVQDQLIEFIKRKKDQYKDMEVCWHGGEPTMALSSIDRILKLIHEEVGIPLKSHTLVTNGYSVNNTFIDIFKKYPLTDIQITIDGDRSAHNKNRISKSGEETYDKIINNVDRLTIEFPSVRIGLRMNVHKNNANQFLTLYETLSKRWEKKNIHIYPAFVSENTNCSVSCFNSKEKTIFMYEIYKAIGKRYRQSNLQLKSGLCTAHFESSFVIDPQGYLYKCWVDVGQPQRAIGNLRDGITNANLACRYMLGTDKFSDEKCLNCSLFPICDGGCSRYRFEDDYKTSDLCPFSESEIINFMV